MGQFHDLPDRQRSEQTFATPAGGEARVWADYAVQGDRRVILHVEADPALRGMGAASDFMRSLAEHGRAEGIRFTPRCGYAVAWFRRHPDQQDLLA